MTKTNSVLLYSLNYIYVILRTKLTELKEVTTIIITIVSILAIKTASMHQT